MADLGCPLPDREVILQVAAAEAGVARQAVAPLLDELRGQVTVGGGARLAVQLDQGRLNDGMAVKAPALARELLDQVVGEPDRDVHRVLVAGAPGQGDRGLEEVAVAVHLVAGGEVLVAGLAARLDVGVQVAVRPLDAGEQLDRGRGEGGECLRGRAGRALAGLRVVPLRGVGAG